MTDATARGAESMRRTPRVGIAAHWKRLDVDLSPPEPVRKVGRAPSAAPARSRQVIY